MIPTIGNSELTARLDVDLFPAGQSNHCRLVDVTGRVTPSGAETMRQMNWSIDDKTLQLDESFPDGDRITISLQKVYEKWSDKDEQWVECDGDCWVLDVKSRDLKTGETVNHSPTNDTGTLPEMFWMACEFARELMARKIVDADRRVPRTGSQASRCLSAD